MREVVIVDAVRTPIGKYKGTLKDVRPDDLGATVIRALVERNPNLPVHEIEEVVLGNANQAGEDNRNVARMSALLAGLPVEVAGTTVNRLCGSGLDAVNYAARTIMTGEADIVIAGGTESMTRAKLTIDDIGLVELNEAFASQSLECIKQLELDRAKVNVNGGAIALGHPLGASGARILTTLVYEMKKRGVKYGLATMCVGVGQGIATIVENPEA